MTIVDLLKGLQSLPFPTAVRESSWLFPTIETIHVLAIVHVVGSISMIDLRLLGVASRRFGVSKLSAEILPWTWISFIIALITGALMFASKAIIYYGNLPFQLKMLLMLCAGLNMVIFQTVTWRGVKRWNDTFPLPLPVRIAGGLSLTFWIGVVFCGRWIGFTT